jgi:ribosomal protein S18 acetylase RimI-like enzyme
MSEILRDASSPAVGRAIQVNFAELFSFWGRSPYVQAYERDGLTWYESGYAAPLLNTVWRTRLTPGSADARIEGMMADFKARKLTLTWSIGSDPHPADLAARLEAHGFSGGDDTGMAADLLALHEGLPHPAGLIIEQVGDAQTLRRCTETSASAFGLSAAFAEGWAAIEGAHGFDPALPRRIYLGWLDGAPVATSYLFLKAGVAGIYSIATLPAVRRRGIGAAMTLHALREAREMGYRVGVLGASPPRYSACRKFGFSDSGVKLLRYIWDGAST